MYAHLSLFGNKMTIKKVHFSQFLKGSLQFIKITLHWLYQLFCKNTTFTVPVRICTFSKKKNSLFHGFLCVRPKSLILRATNVKKTKSHAS